jgi:hypothetical protein
MYGGNAVRRALGLRLAHRLLLEAESLRGRDLFYDGILESHSSHFPHLSQAPRPQLAQPLVACPSFVRPNAGHLVSGRFHSPYLDFPPSRSCSLSFDSEKSL